MARIAIHTTGKKHTGLTREDISKALDKAPIIGGLRRLFDPRWQPDTNGQEDKLNDIGWQSKFTRH